MADHPVAADAWRLRKAKTLVKLLALARGHRLHREALTAVLWPDTDAFEAGTRSEEFRASGKDAMEMGVPFQVLFVEVSE